MACQITGYAWDYDASTGTRVPIPHSHVYALPSYAPLRIKDSAGLWQELEDPLFRSSSQKSGRWDLFLPQQWECDPFTVSFQLVLADGICWGGTVPPPPNNHVRFEDLKDYWGWGLVQGGPNMSVLAVSGPPGPPAAIGPTNITFNPDGSITTTDVNTGQVITYTFNLDGSIKAVYSGPVSTTITTSFSPAGNISEVQS